MPSHVSLRLTHVTSITGSSPFGPVWIITWLAGKLLTLATLERTTTATTAVVVVVVVVVLLLLLLLTCYSATPARLLPLFVLVVAVEVV